MSNATARVTKSIVKNVRRPGAVPALVTALGVLAFIALQRTLSTLVSLIGLATTPVAGDTSGLYELEQLDVTAAVWLGSGQELLLIAVPLAFGVFVSLWIVAPIAASLHLRFVVARSVLAAGIGTVLVFIVGIVSWFVGAVGQSGSLFGNSFPWPGFGLPEALIQNLVTALSVFVATLPVVILGGVLLRNWLRGRDETQEVSGILDEV